jgi:hypothetical protein
MSVHYELADRAVGLRDGGRGERGPYGVDVGDRDPAAAGPGQLERCARVVISMSNRRPSRISCAASNDPGWLRRRPVRLGRIGATAHELLPRNMIGHNSLTV